MSDRWASPYPRGPRAGLSARSSRRSSRHPNEDDDYDRFDARDGDPAAPTSQAYAQHPGSAYPAAYGDDDSGGSLDDKPFPRARHAAGQPANQRQRGDRGHELHWQDGPEDRYQEEWPASVRFVEEDGPDYIVLDLLTGRERRVPKQRPALETFPATRQHPLPGSFLLRLSGYALIGALVGGIIGIVLGSVVLVVSLIRLAAFEQRKRSWRNRQALGGTQRARRGQRIPLPAAATSERLRLLTALGQSLLAIALAIAELSLAAMLLR